MSCSNGRFDLCSCFGIFLAMVVGALVGLAYAFLPIPGIRLAVGVALAIALVVLLFYMASILVGSTTDSEGLARCLCRKTPCLLFGIIGTIITAIVALAILLTPLSIFAIVVVGILAFFLSFTIMGLISYIKCLVWQMCD